MTPGLILPSPSVRTFCIILLLLQRHMRASDAPFRGTSQWFVEGSHQLTRSQSEKGRIQNFESENIASIITTNALDRDQFTLDTIVHSGLKGLWRRSPHRDVTPSRTDGFEKNDVIHEYNYPQHRKRKRRARRKLRNRMRDDLSLWIDGNQVKSFGGYSTEIFVILNGRILPYILDPKFEDHLPVIPSEIDKVTFTWRSGRKKRYYYHFYILSSSDRNVLQDPIVTLRKRGRVPKKPKVFSIMIPCVENASGVAVFHIGLMIETEKRTTLSGTPLTLRLKKRCERVESLIIPAQPDAECDKKCSNGGVCDQEKRCRCPEGHMGQFCNSALCYPQCQNGGTCSAPGKCTCHSGYHGRYCEGGICKESCLNGGKCVQKDTCSCRKGFFGNRCEFSKCVIPCVNGGKCRGANKCKCKPGFAGDHCEIIDHGLSRRLIRRCKSKCRFGMCLPHGKCHCDSGFSGRWCRRKGRSRKKKLWI